MAGGFIDYVRMSLGWLCSHVISKLCGKVVNQPLLSGWVDPKPQLCGKVSAAPQIGGTVKLTCCE